jgi:hypothetical protein
LVTPADPAHLRVEPHTDRIAVTTDVVLGEVRALPDEPVVALRLAARAPMTGHAPQISPGLRSHGRRSGRTSLYACSGDTRIADLRVDRDGLTVTVLGANQVVTLIRLGGTSDLGAPVVARRGSG